MNPIDQPAAVPKGFINDLHDAAAARRIGMLGLLALECQSYPWRTAALELATQELIALQASSAALAPLQCLLSLNPCDLEARAALDQASASPQPMAYDHAILFTGHMVDAPGRKQPRFPPQAESAAARAMTASLETLLKQHPGRSVGIAGGASGGDLLFHEACARLGIETLLRLTMPPPAYLATSVAPSGESWIIRFQALIARLEPARIEVLAESDSLPAWMGVRPEYDVWQRTNLWLAQEAIASASQRTLLALWDGKSGDGPGGTQHLVEIAPTFGISVAPPILTTSLPA
jgi:hypothetical protein